ncbi:hypothetical protein JTE90_012955 [Oedothorax gibbosus]|uniref:Calcineurin-like phosphoesterase domain-containing protein n=1 Tax=Oedothorax gibbosus TaxID=931172 RepID=A0AAV6TY04_9ARAC|nr:hypothetical protein JTE90_012955 [Oedothorax gibbosus]
MVSLTVCLLHSISRFIPKPLPTYAHTYNIPFPQIFHRHLDKQYLEQFEEIFVIGDVHGCYDELKELLMVSNTNDDKILKIFVGDLVNKGPKNKDVLELVRKSKSMLSVRGNHDEVVLREYFNSKRSDYQLKDKNLWIKDLSEEDVNYLVELPYTISIPSLNSVVVHAGLIPGLPKEITDPTDLIHMRNLLMTDYFWESGIVAIDDAKSGEAWAKLWGGPEHVYFGHDAKRKLQKERFATGLDTGCVYGNLLTGMFINGKRKGELVQVKASAVHCPPKVKTNNV